jgi:CubicO group peptidase (beta-lactamase class C family)
MRSRKHRPAGWKSLIVVLMLAAAGPAFAGDLVRPAVEARLAAYVDDLFESEPAWGGALVARDGRVLFEAGYGWSDHAQARPSESRTVYRIQSMSKTFTAMATLMLVERGRLSLDDPVIDHLPELAEAEGVTIRHLLQMESGIPDVVGLDVVQASIDRFHYPDELLEYFVDLPLIFEPGSRFDYSNSNYIALGVIIERISGKPYGRFLKKNIFKPLKMRRSVYDPDDRTFVNARAVGYHDVAVDPPVEAQHYHPSLAYAAGGILSTARNLLKWDQGLYGGRLLSPEILEEAFTRGTSVYGLGWIIHHVRVRGEMQKLVWHSGGGPGFRSLLVRMVDANVTLILLFNTTGVEDLEDRDLFRWVAKTAREVGEIALSEAE